jgi:hypothetical protein
MKLPRTSVIVAGLTSASAAALAWAATQFHWTSDQALASSAAGVATIALLGFVAEHVRKETPSRWVGIFGLLTTEVPVVFALGLAFTWWTQASNATAGLIASAITIVAAGFGVTVAQSKVTSPETLKAAVGSAHKQGMAATGRKLGDGSDLPGAPSMESGQVSWLMVVLIVVVTLLVIAVFWGWRP